MRVTTLVLGALSLLSMAPLPAQSYRAIKDWVGACDNTRHCTAFGYGLDANESNAFLRFERGGIATDEITRLSLHFDGGADTGAVAQLRADGQELLRIEPRHRVANEFDELHIGVEDAAEAARVFAALRSAQSIELVVAGSAVDTVSLAGASAVMLWIDEQQQRLGTTTALVRRGSASMLTPPPPAPRVFAQTGAASALSDAETRTLTAAVRAALPVDSCEPTEPESGPQDAAWRLDATQTLIQLACFSGAYNVGSNWFVQRNGAAAQALRLPVPQTDGSGRMRSETDLINADFDPATGILSQFNRGRGIGDCGVAASWAWDGKRFNLRAYTQMDECRGVRDEFWPVLWRTQ